MGRPCSRRRFLGLAATAPLAVAAGCGGGSGSPAGPSPSPTVVPPSSGYSGIVALTRARSYGAEAAAALRQALDLLGGIGSLVRDKTVTVKVNFTGWPIQGLFGRTAGETYVTHGDTALALAQILSENGARRIRFVESEGVALPLEDVVAAAGWDVRALQAISGVEFENTRNLGRGSSYARPTVPGGRLFSYLDVNHSYADTDVFVSLCKMKEHATAAGITLSMKNLFGITPNALYGSEDGRGQARLPRPDPRQGRGLGAPPPRREGGPRNEDRGRPRAAHDRGREPGPPGAPRDRGRDNDHPRRRGVVERGHRADRPRRGRRRASTRCPRTPWPPRSWASTRGRRTTRRPSRRGRTTS